MLMQCAILECHVDEHFDVCDDLGKAEYSKAEMSWDDGLQQSGGPEVEGCEWHRKSLLPE